MQSLWLICHNLPLNARFTIPSLYMRYCSQWLYKGSKKYIVRLQKFLVKCTAYDLLFMSQQSGQRAYAWPRAAAKLSELFIVLQSMVDKPGLPHWVATTAEWCNWHHFNKLLHSSLTWIYKKMSSAYSSSTQWWEKSAAYGWTIRFPPYYVSMAWWDRVLGAETQSGHTVTVWGAAGWECRKKVHQCYCSNVNERSWGCVPFVRM